MDSRDGVVSDTSKGWNGTRDRLNAEKTGNSSIFWDVVCDMANDASKCATTHEPMESKNLTMDPADQGTLTGQGIVYICAIIFNVVLLYMSIFGQRMTWRASRWQILNVSAWNIVSTVFYASYGDRTPWPNYMHNKDVTKYSNSIKQYCFTTYHSGLLLVMVETLIVFFVPKLDNNFLFSMVWFLLICGFANGSMLFCFFTRLIWGDANVDKMFWYDPLSLYQVVIVVAYGIIIPIYLLTSIMAIILSCVCRIKHRFHHHFELWSTLFYGLVPYVPFMLTSGYTMADFIMSKVPQFFEWSQKFMMEMFRPKPSPDGGTGGNGGSSGGIGDLSIIELMTLGGRVLSFFADVITWTEASIPLLEAVCAFLFFTSYMQQLIFLLSCGRFFNGKRTFGEKKEALPMLFYPSGVHPQTPPQIGSSSEKMIVVDESDDVPPVRLMSPTPCPRPPLQPVLNPLLPYDTDESPSPPSSYHSSPSSPRPLPFVPSSESDSDRQGTSSPSREVLVSSAGARLYSSYKETATRM